MSGVVVLPLHAWMIWLIAYVMSYVSVVLDFVSNFSVSHAGPGCSLLFKMVLASSLSFKMVLTMAILLTILLCIGFV